MAGDPATNDPLVGQIVDDRWKILERLGEGGMGVVYRGERLKLGKTVAIKFLDERAARNEDSVARFDREARAISRLQHRHCVSILDFGVWRRRPYIVMEYVQGRPLNQEMGKPTMTPVRAVSIMRQILEALRHAHASGVVHRDLKPENVMLTESTGQADFVKLLDFGLARIISVDEPSISQAKTVAGTPSYMSPEQARGEKADHRTDIYSAGVILYGMVTGRKPFRADDAMDVLRMHMNVAPEPPRKAAPDKKISAGLEKAILRALEKERDARFYHCDEFLAALENVPEAHAGEQTARRRGIAGFVAAAVVIAAAIGGMWVWQARRQPKIVVLPPSSLPVPPTLPAVAAPAPAPAAAAAPGPAPALATPDFAVASAARADLGSATEAANELDVPSPGVTPPTLRQRIDTLLDSDKLADAERQLLAQAILEPKAGWVHLDLGEIYARRLWRKDAEREWTTALALDPSLRGDPRLLDRLCALMSPTWQGAGQRLLRHLGSAAAPALRRCGRKK